MAPRIPGLIGGAKKRFDTLYTAIANANPRANPTLIARAALAQMQQEGYVAIRDRNGNVTVKKLTRQQIAQLQAQAQQQAQRSAQPPFGLFPNIGDSRLRWR